MDPETLKAFLQRRIENIKIVRDYLVLPVWHWFDNKKTAIGACFFFMQDWVVKPYYEKVLHSSMPEDLAYAMSVIAAFFTILGVTHKGVQAVTNRIRNGGTNAKTKSTTSSAVID